MSRLQTALHNDIKLAQLARDEIRLHSHLLKADAQARWQQLEQQWAELQEHVGRAGIAGTGASRETQAAMELLADSLRRGYAGIRDALKH